MLTMKRFPLAHLGLRASLVFLLAASQWCAALQAQAQASAPLSEQPASRPSKKHPIPQPAVEKPSQPPAFAIPVESIGFTAPGSFYLGQRYSHVSLDFMDEDHLLFSFRVPGLIRREAEEKGEGDERQIRALVLALPSGTIQSEALWTVHDHARYLWMLNDGHFLLRDRDGLGQGDSTLEVKPLLHFPGPLLWLEMDPAQQFLVTDSHEPATAASRPGDVASPPTADAALTVDGERTDSRQDTVIRILHRSTGQVMLMSRSRSTVHLPINAEGYLESLRGNGTQWLLNLNYFTGGSTVLGKVNSTCSPLMNFVSSREVLATVCDAYGAYRLVALGAGGLHLWEAQTTRQAIWPLLVMGPDGSRLARETMSVDHALNARAPLSTEDIKGQVVEVYDAADGHLALTAPASPVLDAGGNVAISPSGRRVAVLSAGAIQVFELPAPPPLTASADHPAKP